MEQNGRFVRPLGFELSALEVALTVKNANFCREYRFFIPGIFSIVSSVWRDLKVTKVKNFTGE